MDVANASLYDGGSAVAEAVLMAIERHAPARHRSSSPRASIPNIGRRWRPTCAISTSRSSRVGTPDGVARSGRPGSAPSTTRPPASSCSIRTSSAASKKSRRWPTIAHDAGRAVRRQLRSDQPRPAQAAGRVRGRHRRGRGAVAGHADGVTAGRTWASWPAASSSSAGCRAGSSARRSTAAASAAGC